MAARKRLINPESIKASKLALQVLVENPPLRLLQDVIRELLPGIRSARNAGHSLEVIAETLTKNGVECRASTLKTALKPPKTKQSKQTSEQSEAIAEIKAQPLLPVEFEDSQYMDVLASDFDSESSSTGDSQLGQGTFNRNPKSNFIG